MTDKMLCIVNWEEVLVVEDVDDEVESELEENKSNVGDLVDFLSTLPRESKLSLDFHSGENQYSDVAYMRFK